MARVGRTRRAGARGSRGFTLAELMIVVAIVGVLAALAVYSYRRVVTSAGISEAIAVIKSIRAAQHSYHAETMSYLNVSQTLTSWFPATPQKGMKTDWRKWSHADGPNWKRLNVVTDAPVAFGYACVAGRAGESPPSLSGLGLQDPPNLPSNPTEPWFVIVARGERDGDTDYAHAIGTSWSGEVYTENDSE